MRRIEAFWMQGSTLVRIGELAQKPQAPVVFAWDEDFLQSSIELSPLRFQKTGGLITLSPEPFEGVCGLFADSIPDGWGRVLLRKGLAREGTVAEQFSPLDMLSYIGERGRGALVFKPSLRIRESWAQGVLNLEDLQAGVKPILEGTPAEVLDQFLHGGVSPSGIRPKIVARLKDSALHSLDTDTSSGEEWLIKFRAPEDSREAGRIEYIYSQMARDAGLRVPETLLIHTAQDAFFATKLFDRDGDKRIHVHTLSGLLNVSTANFSVGYDTLAKVTNVLTSDMRETVEAYRRCVFNVLSVNQDDHTRNIAFVMDSEGVWSLAPAYDLTFSRSPFSAHKMALYNNGSPTEELLIKFGRDIGIKRSKVVEIVDQTRSALSQFPRLCKTYEVSPKQREEVSSELSKK
ncbi:type II toxin-antitoxin system HipA family toxin [bacterium]|nr:type II toxin-antitoxin system HipA family toxin [bacterium]